MRLSLLLEITSLITVCLLVSGCPEKSPPVTQNQGHSSLIRQAHAEPVKPTTPSADQAKAPAALKPKKKTPSHDQTTMKPVAPSVKPTPSAPQSISPQRKPKDMKGDAKGKTKDAQPITPKSKRNARRAVDDKGLPKNQPRQNPKMPPPPT